jgi:hypothetical protein
MRPKAKPTKDPTATVGFEATAMRDSTSIPYAAILRSHPAEPAA